MNKIYTKLLTLSAAAVLLSSCFGDDTEYPHTIAVDSYYIVEDNPYYEGTEGEEDGTEEGKYVYGVGHTVFSQNGHGVEDFTVVHSTGYAPKETFDMMNYYMRAETDLEEDPIFETPEEGTVNFQINFLDGEVMTAQAALEDNIVAPATLDHISYNSDKEQLELVWERADNAESVAIEMYNEKGELVYASPSQTKSDRYIVEKGDNYWINGEFPIDGDIFEVVIISFLAEEDALSLNGAIQCISNTRAYAEWAPEEEEL